MSSGKRLDQGAKISGAQASDVGLGDLEASTLAPAVGPEPNRNVRVPGLTLLAHPDPSRVGERVALSELVAGARVEISRLTPIFSAAASPLGSQLRAPRPLADAQMSRRGPILSAEGDGGVILSPAEGARVPVFVAVPPDLEPGELSAPLSLSPSSLEVGVILHSARVALLIHLVDPTPIPRHELHGMVGQSEELSRLREAIDRVAALDVPVLILGESGSGKELVAEAIHRASGRRGEMVSVNMAAIPQGLASAELFGSVKGAYTGAERGRRGYFARAEKGTLFLDEIGEASTDLQALLLRALESGEIQPIGGEHTLSTDVRVIAATDADLEAAMAKREFRAPLMHRLSGTVLKVPPLRKRREDIPRLFFHFLRQDLASFAAAPRLGVAGPRELAWLPAPFIARLVAHGWPGNIRQLRNIARHVAVHYRDRDVLDDEIVAADSLLAALVGAGRPEATPPISLGMEADEKNVSPADGGVKSATEETRSYRQPSQISEEELLAILREHGYRLQPTARALGISRTSLYALIDRSEVIHRAGDLDELRIRQALDAASGDLELVVEKLKVSKHGLLQRMRELGIQ